MRISLLREMQTSISLMHISPPSSRRTPIPRAGLRHTQVKVKTENPKRRATVERKDVRMGRGTHAGRHSSRGAWPWATTSLLRPRRRASDARLRWAPLSRSRLELDLA